MEIKFCCNTCEKSFEVDDTYLIAKSAVVCPNCDSKFPDETLVQLKQAVALIGNARSQMKPEDIAGGYAPIFEFTVID